MKKYIWIPKVDSILLGVVANNGLITTDISKTKTYWSHYKWKLDFQSYRKVRRDVEITELKTFNYSPVTALVFITQDVYFRNNFLEVRLAVY